MQVKRLNLICLMLFLFLVRAEGAKEKQSNHKHRTQGLTVKYLSTYIKM